jgi:hypothetical protein
MTTSKADIIISVEPLPADPSGWVRAFRGNEPIELMALNKSAYILAAVIALRARWQPGFNRDLLAPGEAKLGDFQNYGLTEQEYRTAKGVLERNGFATFRASRRGTIGKLTDSRLFFISEAASDGHGHPTDSQRTGNGQPTDTQRSVNGQSADSQRLIKKGRMEERKEGEGPSPRVELTAAKRITSEKELAAVQRHIEKIKSGYEPHQTVTIKDKERLEKARARKKHLMAELGVEYV